MSVAMAEPAYPAGEPAPPTWAELPPGPELAAALAEAERAGLDDFELVEAMAAYRRLSSWAQAQEMGAVLSLSARRRRGPAAKVLSGTADCSEFVPVEVALTLGLTDYSAVRLVQRAYALADRFPAVFTALGAGQLDMPRVLIILEKTGHLSDALCSRVEAAILPGAFWQTTAQLRDTVEREVAIADPATAEERRQQAIAQRRLVRHNSGEGTSGLYLLDAPPELTAAIYQRVTVCARQMKNAGDRCSMGVLRADILTAWGLGADPTVLHECPPPKPKPGHDDAAPDYPADEPEAASDDAPNAEPSDQPGPSDWPDPFDQPELPDPHDLPDLPPPPDVPSGPWDDDPEPGFVGLFPVCDDDDACSDPADTGEDSGGSPRRPASVTPPAGLTAPGGFGVPGGFGAVGGINLVIPLETARGRAQRPGELDGYGPILPVPSRQLLHQATTDAVPWRWTVVDDHGRAVYHGTTGHRPNAPGDWDALLRDVQAQLAARAADLAVTGCSTDHPPPGEPNTTRYRFPIEARIKIGVRDRTCRTPGCRTNARLADVDHTVPHHLHGPTCACNGGPECRHHHRTKQQEGWHLDQPRPGLFVLTTPAGHQYTTEPDPYPT
jgi:hypothetical protein